MGHHHGKTVSHNQMLHVGLRIHPVNIDGSIIFAALHPNLARKTDGSRRFTKVITFWLVNPLIYIYILWQSREKTSSSEIWTRQMHMNDHQMYWRSPDFRHPVSTPFTTRFPHVFSGSSPYPFSRLTHSYRPEIIKLSIYPRCISSVPLLYHHFGWFKIPKLQLIDPFKFELCLVISPLLLLPVSSRLVILTQL